MNGGWFGIYADGWWGESASTQPDVPMPPTASGGYSLGTFHARRSDRKQRDVRNGQDDRDLIDILTLFAQHL